MANCIAKATGYDNSRVKETHRLGSASAKGEANTWRTFASVEVNKYGSCWVKVVRDGKVIHAATFGPEGRE